MLCFRNQILQGPFSLSGLLACRRIWGLGDHFIVVNEGGWIVACLVIEFGNREGTAAQTLLKHGNIFGGLLCFVAALETRQIVLKSFDSLLGGGLIVFGLASCLGPDISDLVLGIIDQVVLGYLSRISS